MPQWVCAAKIVTEYVVAEAKLLEYSARGNLPCRRGPDGTYFDLDRVARLFRPRSAAGSAGLGTLGEVKLGAHGAHSDKPEHATPVRRQRLVRHTSPSPVLSKERAVVV